MASAAGCGGRSKTVSASKTEQQVHIKSFSDITPVRLLVAARPYVFSASERGLDRWDPATGDVLQLDASHGLPGNRVDAMAYDGSRGWLWIATDGGMTRYRVREEIFDPVPKPPSVLGLDSFTGAYLEPASDGGLWIAHKRGLFYTTAEGKWTGTGITDPVDAALLTRSGWLWFGSPEGLVGRRPDGESFRFGQDEGCDVKSVRLVAEAPGGAPMFIGENQSGQQRVTIIINNECATYRVEPEQRWLATARRAEDLVILTSEGLHLMSIAPPDPALNLGGTDMQLVPEPGANGASAPPLPYQLHALELRVPAGGEVMTALDDEIYVGSETLGSARLGITGATSRGWFRRGDVVEDAYLLTVACKSRDDCFVGTSGAHAWHYDGESFERVDVHGAHVLAFIRANSGDIFALVRRGEEAGIAAYQYTGGQWNETMVRIDADDNILQLRCARVSPTGLLWVGLEYRDLAAEWRAHGTAAVDLEFGAVVYHRDSISAEDAATGVIPIPIGVVDIAFVGDEELWVATTEGAARVRGTEVRLFSEADGLESEFLRGIAVNPGGIVFAASGRGIAQYDGQNWVSPKALRAPTNDVEMGADGRLWMATDRGVTVFDGAKVLRLDESRGLLQNEIEEIRADHFGRLWVRGSRGITVITP